MEEKIESVGALKTKERLHRLMTLFPASDSRVMSVLSEIKSSRACLAKILTRVLYSTGIVHFKSLNYPYSVYT